MRVLAARPSEDSSTAERLRRAMRSHAAGVTIVTVPGPAGFTATSFTSVSLKPALVSFCLDRAASTLPQVQAAEHFAVHLLAADGVELARRFARSGTDRFAGIRWTPTSEGVPLLQDAPGWLLATVMLRQRLGDHIQVVGELLEVGGGPGEAALVYHDGGFAAPHPLRAAQPTPTPTPTPALTAAPAPAPRTAS